MPHRLSQSVIVANCPIDNLSEPALRTPERGPQMATAIAKFSCHVCHHDHEEVYLELESIKEVICPGCELSSLSAAKCKEIVTGWVNYWRNEELFVPSDEEEGEESGDFPWRMAFIGLPDGGSEFSVAVYLVD